MTLEDFVESCVAGWVPLALHPTVHGAAVMWRWVMVHICPWVLAILAARRK